MVSRRQSPALVGRCVLRNKQEFGESPEKRGFFLHHRSPGNPKPPGGFLNSEKDGGTWEVKLRMTPGQHPLRRAHETLAASFTLTIHRPGISRTVMGDAKMPREPTH